MFQELPIRALGRVFFLHRRLLAALGGSICLHLLTTQWPIGAPAAWTSGISAPARLDALIMPPRAVPQESTPPWPAISDESDGPPPGSADETGNTEPAAPFPAITSDIYHPREDLTRPPQLEQDVDLSPLTRVMAVQALTLELALFINEAGLIDRIEIIRGNLEETARIGLVARLSRLKFASGEIDGKPVKSLLRIEVNFAPPIPGTEPPNARPPGID